MIPLSRPAFGPEEEDAVRDVLRSGWVAQGPATAAFEREAAQALGVPHAIAVSSCTTALHLAVLAAGVGPGDEVILPAFTFPATANAVLYAGAVPVLVDVEPETLNICPRAAEAAVTERTKAVIGVHLFGFPFDVAALRSLCERHGLHLLEDAACAIGTRIDDRMAGGFGDVACFSLHARKVITCGEGGLLTTGDADLAEHMKSLRTHGADRSAEAREGEGLAPPSPRYGSLGYNYRLSDIQAAVASVQLRRLDGFVRERNDLAARYDTELAGLPGLRLPPRRPGCLHSYQSYVVVVERDAPVAARPLMDALAAARIATRTGTYAVHLEPYYRKHVGDPPSLPVAEHAGESSVALPLFNGLSEPDQRAVIDAVRTAWTGAGARLG
ncbi:MAG TPA: DegT/DnrJ/EryC1/StrS family aminotransferase [bacterium]|nr:DegT/DnrJ/EryC1/StrS family aminotransferase [bacterium]